MGKSPLAEVSSAADVLDRQQAENCNAEGLENNLDQFVCNSESSLSEMQREALQEAISSPGGEDQCYVLNPTEQELLAALECAAPVRSLIDNLTSGEGISQELIDEVAANGPFKFEIEGGHQREIISLVNFEAARDGLFHGIEKYPGVGDMPHEHLEAMKTRFIVNHEIAHTLPQDDTITAPEFADSLIERVKNQLSPEMLEVYQSNPARAAELASEFKLSAQESAADVKAYYQEMQRCLKTGEGQPEDVKSFYRAFAEDRADGQNYHGIDHNTQRALSYAVETTSIDRIKNYSSVDLAELAKQTVGDSFVREVFRDLYKEKNQ